MEHYNVNHPTHHTNGIIEVTDFIEDKKLGYHLDNAIKYISRAGKKDPEKDGEGFEKSGVVSEPIYREVGEIKKTITRWMMHQMPQSKRPKRLLLSSYITPFKPRCARGRTRSIHPSLITTRGVGLEQV